MEGIAFWKNWTPEFRRLFLLLAACYTLAVLFFGTHFIVYPDPSIKWVATGQDEVIAIPVHQIKSGPYTIELKADSFIRWEAFTGSGFNYERMPWYVFFSMSILAMVVLMTLHSMLTRFWFFSGSGLLIFIITALRTDALFPSLPWPSMTVVLIILWVIPGILFQFRYASIQFRQRLLIYALVVCSSLTAIVTLTKLPEPVLYLTTGLIPPVLLLMLLFTVLVAHEIMAAMVYLISRPGTSRNGLRDFIILSVIYLLNISAIYFNDLHWFEWPYSIHPLFLLVISGTLSVWGIRRQQNQFLDTEPYGVLFMLSLGLATFSGLGFFYTSANDPLFATIRDLSLYIHIGYGAVFVAYMVANFGQLLLMNARVNLVMYQPRVLPFFSFRFGGMVATLAFIFFNIWQRPVNDSIGGYYNSLADYYFMTGDEALATGYQKMAIRYAYNSHHGNYVLAEQAGVKGNVQEEKKYLQQALERRPVAQTYINLSNLLEYNGRSLEAYTYLKNGTERIKQNSYLLNALGLIQYKLGEVDSAYLLFESAGKASGNAGDAARINQTSLLVTEGAWYNADSLYQIFDHPAAQANVLTLASKQGVQMNLQFPFRLEKDSALNDHTATLLNNYLVNRMDSIHEENIKGIYRIVSKPSNKPYAEALLYTLGHVAYLQGMVKPAMRYLEEALVMSENKGKYNNVIALWMIEQDAPQVALRYNDFAVDQGYADALLTRAVLLAENKQFAPAAIAWDSLKKNDNRIIRYMAEMSKRILLLEPGMTDALSDTERYGYSRYKIAPNDSVFFNKMIQKISDGNLRARAILDRADYLFRLDRISEAIRVFKKLESIPISDEALFQSVSLLELRMLAARRELSLLAKQINKGFRFDGLQTSDKKYFTGLLSVSDTAKARINYAWIIENNPLYEDGMIAAADFFRTHTSDHLKPYTILTEALHANPSSVKILKHYIREASRIGFTDFAATALEDLRKVISEPEVRAFLSTVAVPPVN